MKTTLSLILSLALAYSAWPQTNSVPQGRPPIEPDVTIGECFLMGLVLSCAIISVGVVIYVQWKCGEAEQGELAHFVLQRQDYPGAPWVNLCTNTMLVDTNYPPIRIYEDIIKTNKIVKYRAKCYRAITP